MINRMNILHAPDSKAEEEKIFSYGKFALATAFETTYFLSELAKCCSSLMA